jgi:hypothetical protein
LNFSSTESNLVFKDIAIDHASCLVNNCNEDCGNENCKFCVSCIDEDDLKDLHRAYQEHQRKGEMMRLFPSIDHFEDEFIEELSPKNQLMTKWFRGKCENDGDEWC